MARGVRVIMAKIDYEMLKQCDKEKLLALEAANERSVRREWELKRQEEEEAARKKRKKNKRKNRD